MQPYAVTTLQLLFLSVTLQKVVECNTNGRHLTYKTSDLMLVSFFFSSLPQGYKNPM